MSNQQITFKTNLVSSPNGLGAGLAEGSILSIQSNPPTGDLTCVIFQNPSWSADGRKMGGNVLFVSQAFDKNKGINIKIQRGGMSLKGQLLGLHILGEADAGGEVFQEWTVFQVF